jgi:hypothetical protein
VAVGGEKSRAEEFPDTQDCYKRRWPLLTSSVYTTSSTAYFSLKYSLEWILKGKHKECQGKGVTTAQHSHLPAH